jgi:hypothetical protein
MRAIWVQAKNCSAVTPMTWPLLRSPPFAPLLPSHIRAVRRRVLRVPFSVRGALNGEILFSAAFFSSLSVSMKDAALRTRRKEEEEDEEEEEEEEVVVPAA